MAVQQILGVVFSISLGIFGTSLAFANGDLAQGAALFKKKCASCHALSEEARALSGPHLAAIVDARAGQVEGFKYSKALQQAATAGLIWSPAQLDQFLTHPKAFLKHTKMNFIGLKVAADRQNLIAFLAQTDKAGTNGLAKASFDVPEELLALEGDLEYGEYLSSECMTCHQKNGKDTAIPSIINKPSYELVTALYAYREGYRENQAMQLIAKRLTDEEIAALAYYFESIRK
ncbi:MAG: cytochrome C [Marinovum sp.]|nr:cytochrome C [Marinovum sp.]